MSAQRREKRAYGSGSIIEERGSWYGKWRVGERQVKRKLGPVRPVGSREGFTRKQAEAELRRMMSEVKTVTNHLNFAHGVFQFAIKRGWASTNPVAATDRPRATHADPDIRFLSGEELEALLRAVSRDDVLGPTDHAVLMLAAMTGLRQGELVALQEWMGHRDFTTTLVYADFAPDPAGGAAFAERAFGRATGFADVGSMAESPVSDASRGRLAPGSE